MSMSRQLEFGYNYAYDNLLEYCDNYADSSGSLYQFQRDQSPINDNNNPLNVALDNSVSFKYKASVLGKAF